MGDIRPSPTDLAVLFNHMLNGFAYCQMVFDGDRPVDFLYLQVNPAFERLTGLVDVEGKLVSEVIPGIQESDPGLLEIYGRVARTQIPERFETYLEALKIWFDVSVYSPRAGEFVAVFDNITERKKSVEILSESEALFHAIFQGISDSAIFTGPDRKIRLVNSAFEKLFRYTHDEIEGKTTELLYAEISEYREDSQTIGKLGKGRGRSFRFEKLFRRKDGSVFWAEVSLTKLYYPDGRELGYFGIQTDITQRLTTQETLKRSEELYRLLAENISDVVWILDLKTLHYRFVSPSVTMLRGYTIKEAMAQNPKERMSPTSAQYFAQTLTARLTDRNAGKEQNYYVDEIEQTRKDGTTVWTEVTTRFITNSETGQLEIYGVSRNISERKRLQAQLLQSQKMESLGTLSSGIAHDFNNILGGILGNAALLEKQPTDHKKVFARAHTISQAAIRGGNLVRQLLTFSRKTDIHFASVSLNAIVEEVGKVLHETLPTAVSLIFELTPNIPPIEADETQVHQVIFNLCINARDAMPTGGHLTLRTSQSSSVQVTLEVSDTGIGIEEANQHRIFEPFFTTKSQGTGLGLSTVFGIMEGHHGSLSLKSELGKGTSFFCNFPIAKEPTDQIKSILESGVTELVGTQTVLIVEDERDILVVLSEILEGMGFKVLQASDGIKALELYEQNSQTIGLVISDLGLPAMGGGELCRRIVENNPALPLVITSGYFEPGIKKRLQDIGVMEFFQKPYNPQEVADAIHRLTHK